MCAPTPPKEWALASPVTMPIHPAVSTVLRMNAPICSRIHQRVRNAIAASIVAGNQCAVAAVRMGSCAHRSAVPRPTAARLQFAADVLRTEAGTLGTVTKAANRHRVEVVTDGGHHAIVIRRDSVRPERPAYVAARPWRKRAPRAPSEPAPLRPVVASVPPPAAPRHCALVAARATAGALRRGRRAADDYFLRQAVAERARNA